VNERILGIEKRNNSYRIDANSLKLQQECYRDVDKVFFRISSIKLTSKRLIDRVEQYTKERLSNLQDSNSMNI
jgi:hypothetical protein